MAFDKIYFANGFYGLAKADVANKESPTLDYTRFFDNSDTYFGNLALYKGSASDILYFDDISKSRQFVIEGAVIPAPEGETLLTPPLYVVGVYEVTAGKTFNQIQRVELRGGVTEWDQIPSIAFTLLYSYTHPHDGKFYVAKLDGYTEGTVTPNFIDSELQPTCEIIKSLSCGGDMNRHYWDPDIFSVLQWNSSQLDGTPPESPLALIDASWQIGFPQVWPHPAIRQMRGVVGNIFVIENRFAVVPRAPDGTYQPLGGVFYGFYHNKATDYTVKVGPFAIKDDVTGAPFVVNNTHVLFDVDSSYYAYFASANGLGLFQIRQFSQGTQGAETVYNKISSIPLSARTFPRELPLGTTVRRDFIRNIVVKGNYAYVFYMAILPNTDGQWTPCITVFDVTDKNDDPPNNGPVWLWDESFTTSKADGGMIDTADKKKMIWNGRPTYMYNASTTKGYLYAPTTEGLAIFDVSCITKKRPDFISYWSAFGNIKYPAEHASFGSQVPGPVLMPVTIEAICANGTTTATESCGGVPQENPEIDQPASIPPYRPWEWHGSLWRALGEDPGKICRLNFGRNAGQFFRVRSHEVHAGSAVTTLELPPFRPEKVGKLATGGASNWSPSAAGIDLESAGFWYGTNVITAAYNDILVFSIDNKATWHIATFTAKEYEDLTTFLGHIKIILSAAVTALNPAKSITSIVRDGNYKIAVTISSGDLDFDWSKTPPLDITKTQQRRSTRFGQQIFGATVETADTDTASVVTMANRILYPFDALYTDLVKDLSRWG